MIDGEILVRIKKVRDNTDRIREFAEDSKEVVDERKYAYAEGIAEDTIEEIEKIKGLLGADDSNGAKKEVELGKLILFAILYAQRTQALPPLIVIEI